MPPLGSWRGCRQQTRAPHAVHPLLPLHPPRRSGAHPRYRPCARPRRWPAIGKVAAVAAFADRQWRPTVTAGEIAARANIALISITAGTEAARLVQAIIREIGGGAERALGRAEPGLAAVLAAESAGGGVEELRAAGGRALGTRGGVRPRPDQHPAAARGDAARAAA